VWTGCIWRALVNGELTPLCNYWQMLGKDTGPYADSGICCISWLYCLTHYTCYNQKDNYL